MKQYFFLGIFFGATLLFPGNSRAQTAPQIPQNLAAEAISACGVQLTWSQPDAADYFNIRVNNGTWVTLPMAGGTGNFQILRTSENSTLRPGQTETYQIQACANIATDNPCSNGSTIVSAETPAIPDAPAVPGNLKTERWEENGTRVVLSWLFGETGATKGIRIFRSDAADGSNSVPVTTTRSTYRANELGSTWSDLVSTDAPHAYRIKTYSTDLYCPVVDDGTPEDAYWVKFSGSASEALTIPSRPATIGVKETRDNNSKAAFEWGNVGNETGYVFQIWQDGTATPGNASAETHAADVTGTDLYSLNGVFNYRVKACNATGNTIGCSDFRVPPTPFSSGLVPPQSTRLVVQNLDFRTQKADVALMWNDFASYERNVVIYRKLASDASFPATPTRTFSSGQLSCTGDTPLVCSVTDTNVDLGSVYEYQVRFKALSDGSEIASPETLRVNLDLTPIKGLGWSSSVGWVSVNSETTRPDGTKHSSGEQYGIFYDSEGTVLGEARVQNYGWISFYPEDLSGCPDGSAELCRAKIVVAEDGKQYLRGWGRFLSAKDGSWHGWISFGEKKINGSMRTALGSGRNTESWWTPDFLGVKMRDALEKPTAGFASLVRAFRTWIVSAQTVGGLKEVVELKSVGTLSGQAWGGDLVGWIGFGCGDVYGISCNQPPVVSNVTVDLLSASEGWCAQVPTYAVRWNYSDPDGDTRRNATIRFKKVSDGTVSATQSISDPSSTPNQQHNFEDPLGFNDTGRYNESGFLAPGTEYRAEVIVTDSAGNASLAAASAPFTTSPYYYPLVSSAYTPSTVTPLAPVTFTDASVDRSAQSIALSRQWVFSGTPATSQAAQVNVIFGSSTPSARLTVTDTNGRQCMLEETLPRTGSGTTGTKRRVFIER